MTTQLSAAGCSKTRKAAVAAMLAASDDASVRVEAARVAGLYDLTVDQVLDAYEAGFNSVGPGATTEDRVSDVCHRLTREAERHQAPKHRLHSA